MHVKLDTWNSIHARETWYMHVKLDTCTWTVVAIEWLKRSRSFTYCCRFRTQAAVVELLSALKPHHVRRVPAAPHPHQRRAQRHPIPLLPALRQSREYRSQTQLYNMLPHNNTKRHWVITVTSLRFLCQETVTMTTWGSGFLYVRKLKITCWRKPFEPGNCSRLSSFGVQHNINSHFNHVWGRNPFLTLCHCMASARVT